ncbi:MAG: hypothetical protein AAGH15_04690 [Myxococcota bacterium]
MRTEHEGPSRPGSDPAAARLRALVIGTLALVVLASAAFAHGAARRARASRAQPARAALVRATGLPDLALSSTARWLRHPSQSERGAATQDLPGALDTDPAGALLGPPFPPEGE